MLLLQDAMNAYLAPLLKKHSVGCVLTVEDLTASLEAAKALAAESTGPNDFILKRLQLLHNSQVKAYQETAKKSLEHWAQENATLPAVSKGESQEAFVARCWTSTKSNRPNWELSDALLEECMYKIVLKRATEAYQAVNKPTKRLAEAAPLATTTDDEEGEIEENEEEEGEMMEEDNNHNTNDDDEEEGEVEEDGEDGEVVAEEGDPDEEEPEETTATKKQPNNNNNNNNKRKKHPRQAKATTTKRVVKKKTTAAKKAPPGKAAAGKKVVAARTKKVPGKKGRAASKNA